MTKAKAAVQLAAEEIEVRELPVPEVGDLDAVLRVEACGMCGTDYELYFGHIKPYPDQTGNPGYPFIPGHEPVGIIDSIGAEASARWGVKKGDRVAVGANSGIGLTSTSRPPALWGGYAEYMYMAPHSRVFPVSKSVPAEAAATFNALAGGVYWGVLLPDLRIGQSIAILGPGQRGLAAVVAAKAAGASFVVVTGLTSDAYKLDLAREFGADMVIDAEREDVPARVLGVLPEGVDVVLDTTPYDIDPFVHAMTMVREGGTVVEASSKAGADASFAFSTLTRKRATLKAAASPTDEAVRAALKLIEAGKHPSAQLVTHRFPLEQAGEALRTLAGKYPDRQAINVILVPG